MTVSVKVDNRPITATVSGDGVAVTVTGGVGPQGPAGVGSWDTITGKPSAFQPSSHAGSHGQGSTDPITIVAAQVSDFTAAVVAAAPPTTDASLLTSGTLDAARLPASAVITTDARLSDSREWSASTVSQADAEAGTATDRRAWTVLRVWQAISAWWAASAAKTKLDGIATGATANATDAQLRDRSTHTGTQAISTVSGLQTALDGKAPAPSGDFTDPSFIGDASIALYDYAQNRAWLRANDNAVTVQADYTSSFRTALGLGSLATLSPTGTADSSRYLRGDGAWSTVSTYTLPVATSSVLGGVKQGSNVTIDGSGVISVAAPVTSLPYSSITDKPSTFSPSAHASSHGSSGSDPIAVAGSQVTISGTGYYDCTLNGNTDNAAKFLLAVSNGTPAAARDFLGLESLATLATSGTPTSSTFLRGDGVWSTAYTLPAATTSVRGGVVVGTGLAVASGTVSIASTAVTPASYGSASSVGTFTVGADGRLTAAGSTAIAISAGSVSGLAASATTDTTSASNISSGTLSQDRLPAANRLSGYAAGLLFG